MLYKFRIIIVLRYFLGYNNSMKKYVGDKLRECRLACEMTQKDVAKRLGVSQPVYNRYEKGICECTYLQLARLCDIFDVSADYILGRRDY